MNSTTQLPRTDSQHSLNEPPLPMPISSSSTQKPLFVGVAGGSASGKKAVCRMICERLQGRKSGKKVVMLSLEDFYRNLTPPEITLAEANAFNFDHPDAFDWRLLEDTLVSILNGEVAHVPKWDFKTHQRSDKVQMLERPDAVVLEGILVLYKKRIRDSLDMKLFVDVDSDVRLSRQVIRDTTERYTYDLATVLDLYIQFVKPSFEDFILPSKKFADVIIPRGSSNTVAIDLISQHVFDVLETGSTLSRKSLAVEMRKKTKRGALDDQIQDEFTNIPK